LSLINENLINNRTKDSSFMNENLKYTVLRIMFTFLFYGYLEIVTYVSMKDFNIWMDIYIVNVCSHWFILEWIVLIYLGFGGIFNNASINV
jgi:hypothetical protein